jgi:DNA-binding transcriptional ArsR family regulator
LEERPAASRSPEEEGSFQALVEVMTGHPLRHRVLSAVCEQVQGRSIREIAARVGEPERRVRHQVEALLESGLIGVARQEERRGTVARYYRAERVPLIWSSEQELSESQLETLGTDILRLVMGDAAEAVRAGTFPSGDCQVYGRIRYPLDRRGCVELKEIYERALGEAERAARASAERAASAPEQPVEMVGALLLFEAPLSG